MKKIGKFFKRIYKVIDSIIITPISKLVYKIVDKINSNPGKFERWLNKPNVIVYLSLILAFITFVVVDQKVVNLSDTQAIVISNQKLDIEYNEETYVVEGIPETVDIVLMGRKSELYLAEQLADHKVTLDLSGLGSGTHKVNLKYNNPITSLSYKIDPSTTTVVLYPKVSEVRTVTVDTINTDKLNETLTVSSVSLSKDKVIIKSYKEKLATVASVKAIVDLNALNANVAGTYTLEKVQLVAYDETGTEIKDVEIIPESVIATVVISSPSKEVPIKIIPVGEVSAGTAIGSITGNINTITLYGDEKSLEKITLLEVEVDVNGIKEGKTAKITLQKPSGVRSMSASTITVKITMESETEKTFSNIAIELQNLKEGYKAFGVAKEDTEIDVVVKGTSSLIKDLKIEDIKAYVDLADLQEGTWEVPVSVTGNDVKLTYTAKVKKVNIKIIKN